MSNADDVMKQINKAFGDEVIRKASDPRFKVTFLPTGVLPIDVLLGGGFPRGRTTELYGDFSTLKSYIALKAIAATQRAGGQCALVDTEHSFDPEWAEELGIYLPSLLVYQPASGEVALDATQIMLVQGFDLVVWDSVAATLPQAEQEKAAQEKVQPARLAEFMSRSLRKLTASNSKTALVYVNQTRLNIGMTFGNPESIPGGKALPFYATYRVSLRKAGKITEPIEVTVPDSEPGKVKKSKARMTVGQSIRAGLEKSKLSAPFREAFFVFDYRLPGVDDAQFLTTYGLEHGVTCNDGRTWWVSPEVTGVALPKTVGREKFMEMLRLSPDLIEAMGAALVSRGASPPDSSKASSPSEPGSSPEEPVSTPVAAQGVSRATGRTKTPSTKSRTPDGPTG